MNQDAHRQSSCSLSLEQRRRIEENRKKALERLGQKSRPQNQFNNAVSSPSNFQKKQEKKSDTVASKSPQISPTFVKVVTVKETLAKSPIPIEMSSLIEENRKRALERLQQKIHTPNTNYETASSPNNFQEKMKGNSNAATSKLPPTSPVIRKDADLRKTVTKSPISDEIAGRIEEKRREAFERLQRHKKLQSDQGKVNLLPDSNKATGVNWSERFSHERKTAFPLASSPKSSFQKGANSTSLIERINKESRREVSMVGQKQSSVDEQKGVSKPASIFTGPPFEIKMILISERRFEAKCSFQTDVIGIFKTMSTKSYDSKTKHWNFLVSEYDRLTSALRSLKINLKLEDIPPKILEMAKEITQSNEKGKKQVDLSRIEEPLLKSLFPFQREGVRYGVLNNGRLLIADDMGLGKTIQAISLASYYRSDWPLLVVSPSSVKVAWAKEFEKRLPSLDPFSINVVHTGKDDPCSGLINIMSYDLLPKHFEILKVKRFGIIIADESHFIKNSKAARTKAAMDLLKSAARVILLSGTPALSRPIELYTQVCAVNTKLFPGVHVYAHRYCDAKKNRFGWDYSGSSNLEELKIVLENKIMIRRLKSQVLDQLPDKQRKIVMLDPSNINSNFAANEAKKLERSTGFDRRRALLQYFSSSCEAKKKAVLEYVADLLEGEQKFLLFAHHQLMLNSITELLEKKKVSFIRIDGSTNPTMRHELVEKFQNENDCLVAVLSITAASTGLNLTAATAVIFAELYWNPGVLVQAEDRVYRIGQKNAVTITYLLAENTADDCIWPLVQSKLDVLTSAGLNQDEFSPEVTKLKDPKQRKILDFFQDLMEDDKDLLQWIEEVHEPSSKRAKVEEL
ncbi:SWI/SNF-related matrix-associated actin-dependent regulator of chromatin subfamily A-like protein 1 [Rhopilema esculentum]|uniref:SWI/SNF-related matrix-associated actin-dependent regulator of chromatin subfamily A-like protein 1 n=1 Tax=Rhopilema esculentum TaxID=499914 RepID=UPI0031D29D60